MICRTEDIKQISNILLSALDFKDEISRVLEIEVINEILTFNITNNEYYITTKLPIYEDIDFHISVNAELLLELISKTTSETIEFNIINNELIILANGQYKLPAIFKDNEMIRLPKIDINNKLYNFDIDGSVFNRILTYNSKQINTGIISKPVQKLFYVDDEGAITFTSGACVNKFKLNEHIKMLFNNKLIKLFKFIDNKNINFTLGKDEVSDNIVQTKVCFDSEYLTITSIIINDDNIINSIPVDTIRNLAFDSYDNTIDIDRQKLIEIINRLSIFIRKNNPYCKFIFNSNNLVISSIDNANKEFLVYENAHEMDDEYECVLDIYDIKSILESYNHRFINIKFGNNKNIVLYENDIFNIIPECTIT